jgi:hypothetical protein
MKIIFISGDGHGAGKTTLAKKLTTGQHQIFSIANVIRFELAKKYPKYNWYDKSPEYKDKTIVQELNMTVREVMDRHGMEKKDKNSLYWAIELANTLTYPKESENLDLAVIDDLRFSDEMNYIKKHFSKEEFIHFHVLNPKALPEPHYENDKLKEYADYLIQPIIKETKNNT